MHEASGPPPPTHWLKAFSSAAHSGGGSTWIFVHMKCSMFFCQQASSASAFAVQSGGALRWFSQSFWQSFRTLHWIFARPSQNALHSAFAVDVVVVVAPPVLVVVAPPVPPEPP